MLTDSIGGTLPWGDIEGVVSVAMFVIAVISAFYARSTYAHQKKRSKKAAACDLAKYYADVIIEKYTLISSVFKRSKLDEYVRDTIPMDSIKNFDQEELKEILKKSKVEYDDFFKELYAISPTVIFNSRMTITCTSSDRGMTYRNYIEIDQETGEEKICNGAFLLGDFFQEVNDMLNQLEWFGMSCRYGLADEKLLYQSLHQTFLSTVQVLYPFISNRNIANEDKFFTNIIWLFDRWRKRRRRIKRRAERREQLLLKIMKKVKPKVYSGSSM